MMAIVLGIPTIVFAKSYTSLNLEETLTREKIEYNLEEYKETSDQIIIYMFRGDRCSYCQKFLNFLNENVKEYGKYFKLRSFEIWHNENNAALMEDVAEHFNKTTRGVPLIVIGEKVFQGYNSSYDEEILETITNYYNNKDTYNDVVATFLIEKEESTIGSAITIIVLVSAIAGSGLLIYMAKGETTTEERKEEAVISTKTEEIKQEEKKEEAKPKAPKKTKAPELPKLKETKTNEKEKIVVTNNKPKTELPKKKETTTKKTTTRKTITKTGTTKTSTTTKKTPSKTSPKKTIAKKTTTKASANTTKKNKASN